MAHGLWQQRCLEVDSRLDHVGVVDETRRTCRLTVGNVTRLGASQRSATRRCASHHIATQRLSRWGSPAARARLARTVPLAIVESRQAESGDRATAQAQQRLQDCAMTLPGFDADDVAKNRGRSFHEMPRFRRERALVAIWSRREDALGCGHNGEQHEQGRSRQSAPQQGWRNQREYGNTLVRTLRKLYGQGFAAGYPETAKLSEVMFHLNETSLSQLRRDHETDHLEHKIAQASK